MPVGSSAPVGRLRLAERTWSEQSASEYLALLCLPFEKSMSTASVVGRLGEAHVGLGRPRRARSLRIRLSARTLGNRGFSPPTPSFL